jgi:hypothetical protein
MSLLPTQKTPPKPNLSDQMIVLVGPRKFGKSEFCSRAEDAIFLNTDGGLNSLEVYQVTIPTWDRFLGACAEIAEGNHPFKTIVIDTIDDAYRLCEEYICERHKIEHESDLPYGKGYALVNNEFYRVLNKLLMLPQGLIAISHAQTIEVETRTGKITRSIPTLREKVAEIVLGKADIVLFCDYESAPGPDGRPTTRRVLRTKPTIYYEAGDRTRRLPETIEFDYGKFVAAFEAGRPTSPTNASTPASPTASAAKPRTAVASKQPTTEGRSQ